MPEIEQVYCRDLQEKYRGWDVQRIRHSNFGHEEHWFTHKPHWWSRTRTYLCPGVLHYHSWKRIGVIFNPDKGERVIEECPCWLERSRPLSVSAALIIGDGSDD
jgi:hypothetical protein